MIAKGYKMDKEKYRITLVNNIFTVTTYAFSSRLKCLESNISLSYLLRLRKIESRILKLPLVEEKEGSGRLKKSELELMINFYIKTNQYKLKESADRMHYVMEIRFSICERVNDFIKIYFPLKRFEVKILYEKFKDKDQRELLRDMFLQIESLSEYIKEKKEWERENKEIEDKTDWTIFLNMIPSSDDPKLLYSKKGTKNINILGNLKYIKEKFKVKKMKSWVIYPDHEIKVKYINKERVCLFSNNLVNIFEKLLEKNNNRVNELIKPLIMAYKKN